MIEYRAPAVAELAAMNAMMLRSKGHWGYDEAFLAACAEELTVEASNLKLHPVLVAFEDDAPIGMAKLLYEDGQCYLHHLFVAPDAMGRGIGHRLLDWARRSARAAGFKVMVIESDPHAALFYEKLGAKRAGSVPSGSIPGRELPRFELTCQALHTGDRIL